MGMFTGIMYKYNEHFLTFLSILMISLLEDQENAVMAGMEDVEEPNWEQQPSLFGKDFGVWRKAMTKQVRKGLTPFLS